MKRAVLVLFLAASACAGDDLRGDISIVTADGAPWQAALVEYAALTPEPASLAVTPVADPAAIAASEDDYGWRIVVVDDAAIPLEGYRLENPAPRTLVAHAHDLLGAQYAVSAALEDLGFRFRHPSDTLVPRVPALAATADADFGVVHRPQIRVRGLHLHTLHPIEGYFALWESGAGNAYDARATVDWVIKNRGNYLQWPALNDILSPERRAAWQAYERAVIDDAHARGIRVGLGVEMFGNANLQLAFDLVDDTTGMTSFASQIAARLHLVLDQLPWDVIAISYGEFFDSAPQTFIDANNTLASELRAQAPQVELHAIVHVGGTQRVDYQGKNIPYYFLVQYADPSIVPDIHSVMYYDLFEPTGGAYQQDNFDEHRQYLVDRMCANQKAGYHPELAYWVAFDDSVPTFLPIYVRSRWLDLDKLPGLAPPPCSPLDAHILFSSGDEWGYWLQNVTILHDSYEHAASPQALIDDAYAPDLGAAASKIVGELADAQDASLITGRLAPYLASRDVIIETGRTAGIVSQPDRVTYDQLVTMAPADRATFEASVLAPLDAHADQIDGFAARLAALDLPDSRWARELRDGLDVDRLRVRFIAATYRTVLAHLAGDDATAAKQRAAAADALARGTVVIEARDADLHDTHHDRLFARAGNSTSYPYGYLFFASTACYWNRELAQVDGALGNAGITPPDCFF